jgi:NAD dependent epimerase/dehydratase family enzyme
VTNREFTKSLGAALKKPTFMPAVPGGILRLMKGEFGNVLLKGQRVLPKKLSDAGFDFHFAQISDALRDLLG